MCKNLIYNCRTDEVRLRTEDLIEKGEQTCVHDKIGFSNQKKKKFEFHNLLFESKPEEDNGVLRRKKQLKIYHDQYYVLNIIRTSFIVLTDHRCPVAPQFCTK